MSDTSPDLAASAANACGLEEVLKTDELMARPARPADYQRESMALGALARHMAGSPSTLLQKLTDTAMEICRAGSAGVSLEERHEGQDIFRWRAVSGRLTPFLCGTMPRDFSPCGVTVDRGKTQLMRHIVRHYPYVAGLEMPINEVLLVPFFRNDRPVGTLWIVSHEETGVFDSEDARLMGSLAQFASAAVETLATLESAERTRFRLDEMQVQLEAALVAGSIATWAWNIPQDRMYADAYCARLFGVSEENARGGPLNAYVNAIHPEDRANVGEHINKAIGSGGHYEVEYRLKNDGTEHQWVIARGKVLRNAQGEAVHMAGVVMDITAHKKAQLAREIQQETLWARERETNAALREARDQALAASRAKDDFLAALSHELRTPLNPVLLLASDLAENMDYPPEVRADFETVRKNVELEARLIDDLLDLTRITNGKLKLDTILVDLHAIARDAEEKVAADAQDKNIHILWDLAADRSLVQGDPVRLQQVFWNVLKNAVKFTPHSGTIRIESRNPASSAEVHLHVHDSGIGIAEEELSTIFDAFAQGAHGGSHVFGGLGLGLAISQRIMQMHSGSITASSPGGGQGSCFSIQMPATDVASRTPEEARPPAAAAAPACLDILLVEDHAPTRQILERLLARRGHHVTPVGSGREACEQVKTRDFDLLICDVGLPDTDGHTLLHELILLRPGLAAIAMTGYGTESDVQKSDQAGFLMHLTKPVSIARLEEALRGLNSRTATA